MTREIPLTQGLVALVDDEDYDRVMAAGKWYALRNGKTHYATRCLKGGRRLYMHAFVSGRSDMDHANRNGLDNRRSNLRTATRSQQAVNQGPRSNAASGRKGVHRDKPTGSQWRARITVNGVRRSLGLFDCPDEAARAYDAAAREAYGEFAWLNFPDPDREQVNA